MSELDGGHEDGFYKRSITPELDRKVDTDFDYKRRNSGQIALEYEDANILLQETLIRTSLMIGTFQRSRCHTLNHP
jgi:hypothetical protein